MSAVDDASAADDTLLANNAEHAYEQVRAAILNATFPPGAVVSQVRLAASLNISRTPLREALRRLQSEGLLQADFNRRVRITPLSAGDMQELSAMRIALEPMAVRASVPRMSPADLGRVERAFEEMAVTLFPTDHAGAVDMDRFRKAHRVFHTELFCKVGERMRRQIEDLWDHAERYRLVYRQAQAGQLASAQMVHHEHEAILEAAKRGDAAGCGRLLVDHLAHTALTAIAQMDPGEDPWLVREAVLASRGQDPCPRSE